MLKKQILKRTFSLIVFCGFLATITPSNAQEIIEAKSVTENEIAQQENFTNETEPQEVLAIENDDITQLPPLPDYTWADFLTNKDCRPVIKELMARPEYNAVYQNLRIACLGEKTSAWENLLATFRKEKQQLLLNQTMNDNSSYIKYLKVVPYLLFDIQDTKPVGNTPMALLDKIEQAIIDRQIEDILPFLNELPINWKNKLRSTQVLTHRLLELKEQLNNLNKVEQEVQND